MSVVWIKARRYRDFANRITYEFRVWKDYVFKITLLHTSYIKVHNNSKKIINLDYKIYNVDLSMCTKLRDYKFNTEKEDYPMKIQKTDLVWLLKHSYSSVSSDISNSVMEELIDKLDSMIKYIIRGRGYSSELVEDRNDKWNPCKTYYRNSEGDIIFTADGWKNTNEDKELLDLWDRAENKIFIPGEGTVHKFKHVDESGNRT